MAQKTSINIKPCNIGSSEAHNKRTAEYLAHINKERLYVRTDLMASNEVWVAPELGNSSLTDRYNQIAQMVKEKTGRKMQTKDRERMNKKTGKVTIVRGSTPLKEGGVVIKDDTTLEQLQHFCEECKEHWGITALQIFIHRDEGHYGNLGDTRHMDAQSSRPYRMGLDEPRYWKILQTGREMHGRDADAFG